MLCDSNILIYAADPDDVCCAPYVQSEDAAIAVVSRIEVLGFPGYLNLSEARRARLHEIIASMVEFEMSEAVIQQAIALRQQKRMRLADAIIAATALAHDLALVTRNVDDFKHIAGLKIVNPFAPG